jgi:AcrR family transcriptional regulator
MARDDKRERLLAAAAAVFAERAFHHVQVSEVAERAGVGKGTVYLYFPTKDDLHRAALEASLDSIRVDVEAAIAAKAPLEETLRLVVVSVLRFFWKRPHLLTVIQRYEAANGRRAQLRRQRVVRAIEDVLARHRVGGNGAERHLAAAFLLGMSRAAILEHAPGDRPEAVGRRLVDVFLHGVGGKARSNGAVPRREAASKRGAA